MRDKSASNGDVTATPITSSTLLTSRSANATLMTSCATNSAASGRRKLSAGELKAGMVTSPEMIASSDARDRRKLSGDLSAPGSTLTADWTAATGGRGQEFDTSRSWPNLH